MILIKGVINIIFKEFIMIHEDRFHLKAKRKDDYFKDWNSIRLSLREIEKLENDPINKSNIVPFTRYLERNKTWRSLSVDIREGIIGKLAIDSSSKNMLMQFLCTF
jgi:hypothetical protein